MKDFFIKNKKNILKMLMTILALILISLITTLILYSVGILYYDNGIKLSVDIFNIFKNSWYGILLILLFQVVITTLLCFIPGSSMAFIILLQQLYENPWQAFLLSFIGVMLSSLLMYVTGRFGGYSLCKRILSEEECNKASDLLNADGAIYFPIMMALPMFPDDALIMVSGTLKMRLKWFIPSVIIGRGVGIATIIFGITLIPYNRFTTPWHWIIFVLICVFLIIVLFYLAYRLNKFLKNRHKK